MICLITGGAGSVGQDLTAAFLREGHQVRVLDRNAEGLAGLRALSDKNLHLMQGRLEDAGLVRDAVRGVDTVIHLAWSFSDDPVELLESDLKGHVILLDASVAATVSRFFYASSAVVYGKPAHPPALTSFRHRRGRGRNSWLIGGNCRPRRPSVFWGIAPCALP